MNPLGYDVFSIAAPDRDEKDHHYLWRFIRHYPQGRAFAIYDRSWYGRVLVERVEGFCSDAEWQRAYQEINDMEEDYVYSSGGAIVKFWLEISKEEQLKRFQQRASDPVKIHKITDEDWRNREKWDQYDEAIDEMLARTSTSIAPWTVIESDDKWYARVKALTTIIDCAKTPLNIHRSKSPVEPAPFPHSGLLHGYSPGVISRVRGLIRNISAHVRRVPCRVVLRHDVHIGLR